ncbi:MULTISPECIES: DUF305 domain-containing protein [Aureimonas]|uniref:DUF305 domain-containing protein n=2 Tax=Aureimonas TaxID=414371 RepID=A0A1H0HEE1_9HYPH|nr:MULTISPECIES: DUF305 domain-containing protein [Aureimonas]MBB3934639.1 uncharacterized protein (DUF305 family) [Aureimonas phyllosphaerae]MBB3950550.1 uncharacterized protein (DUF305 family) [Aureimonas jatrophae]MBB3958145.1 uncharacterized protein (DUF305 family) [Aureimonas phyllosphaerae]SDO17518.1 protein of unknown function [Aureimonas jatrophae]SFE92535.1 protein of unknown function [Aureimonas phyllosphaerae]
MRKILIAAAVAAFPLAAAAQDSHSMAGHGDAAMALPAACEAAAGSMDMSKMMEGMQASMSGGQMDEVQKANHEVMMQMHGPMMKAAMIKDPDLAFNCGMIAHHMGAIAMSEVELKMGKDEKSKEMARMIIDAQRQEIEEMTTRVEALAK